MSGLVIGIVRGESRLENLVLAVRGDHDSEQPWRMDCVFDRQVLEPSSELWRPWNALAAVTAWDATTLDHVLAILRGTVPSADGGGDLPALGADAQPPPPPRATAAHPRAYRGTKHRPPRPAAPPVDVRPYLLARRHIDQVLELLGQPRGIDPYVAWNFRTAAVAGFEPMFVMHVLPLLRNAAWSDVCAFAAAARALGLERDPALRARLVVPFVVDVVPRRVLAWWNHVLGHEPAQRLELAQLMNTEIDPVEPDFAAELAPRPAVQHWSCYRALARGATVAYLRSGFALDAIESTKIDDTLPTGRDDVTVIIEATMDRLGAAMHEDSGPEFWRSQLWRLLGMARELIPLLEHPAFVGLAPPAAFWLLRLVNSPIWSEQRRAMEWAALSPGSLAIAERAATLDPAYQRKYVEDIASLYWISGDDLDDSDNLRELLARALDLARVARPPFSTTPALGNTAPYYVWLSESRLAKLRAAPDASWLSLERACARANDARLIGGGIGALCTVVPDFLVAVFARAPSALIAAADVLGNLSFEQRVEILTAYRALPIAAPSLAGASIEELCSVIAPIARDGGPNPIRRALRRHLAGEVALSEAQLRGHRQRVVDELDVVRLAAIRGLAERALGARVGAEGPVDPSTRHAAALLSQVDVHRRALRRLVTAYVAGDRTWRLRHPRTLAWFARHPRLDRAAWLAGLETRGAIDGVGEVTLAVETDLLEALKLGTYVGSCLGHGGALAYSAAAVVLDVNKHVVYARDASGAVIGRQLIALSEADQLVCFHLYGSAGQAALAPVFRAFDQAFAARLGVLLYRDGDYEIASILSRDFWDDTAWDPMEAPA